MKHIQVPKAVIVLSCLSMVIVTTSILLNIILPGRVSGAQSDNWQTLSALVEPDKLLQIVTDNTAPSADRREISQSAIGMIEGDLLVVDFNSSALCGRGGCAIAAYRVSTGERLLFIYVSQPSGQPIVELTQRSGVELPCLLISPSSAAISEQRTTRETLCYRDDEWTVEDS